MLLICKAKVSHRCIRIQSRHGYSAATKDCICPNCADVLRRRLEEAKDSGKDIASILEGSGDAKTKRRSRIR